MNSSMLPCSMQFCWDVLTRRPICSHCNTKGYVCDYSIKLTWGGKSVRARQDSGNFTFHFDHHQCDPQVMSPPSGGGAFFPYTTTDVPVGSYCLGSTPLEVL